MYTCCESEKKKRKQPKTNDAIACCSTTELHLTFSLSLVVLGAAAVFVCAYLNILRCFSISWSIKIHVDTHTHTTHINI